MRYCDLPTGAYWKFPDGSGLYQKRADGDYEVKTGRLMRNEGPDVQVVLCGGDGGNTVPYSSIPIGGWWNFECSDGSPFQKRADGDYLCGVRFDHERPDKLVVPCADDELPPCADDETDSDETDGDPPLRTFDDVPIGEPFSIGDRDFIRTSLAIDRTVRGDLIVNAWCVTLRQFARVSAAQPVE